MKKEAIPQNVLLSLFDYDTETGSLYRRKGSSVKEVKKLDKWGYITVSLNVNKKRFYFFAHRVVWMMVHGEWPEHTIDHINGVKTDNRIQNLRDITSLENIQAYVSTKRQIRASSI